MQRPTRSTSRPRKTNRAGLFVVSVLRIVRHGPLHPCRNMALDEAMLQGLGPPTLRVYGWSPPGLSLGYFQSARDFEFASGGHVMVRRITGGGAIYHHQDGREITFALTADAGVLPGDVPASYELVHKAVAAALEQNGVATVMAGSPPQGGRPGVPGAWCFENPGGMDLLASDGTKVLGSAQRRLRRPRPRILHQCSLIVPPPASAPPVVEALIARVSGALGLRPEPGELEARERVLAGVLCRERYEDPGFTWRR